LQKQKQTNKKKRRKVNAGQSEMKKRKKKKNYWGTTILTRRNVNLMLTSSKNQMPYILSLSVPKIIHPQNGTHQQHHFSSLLNKYALVSQRPSQSITKTPCKKKKFPLNSITNIII
jgi:hypothetical protein